MPSVPKFVRLNLKGLTILQIKCSISCLIQRDKETRSTKTTEGQLQVINIYLRLK